MLDSLDFYYFSPTGGTKACGGALAAALATHSTAHDLTAKHYQPALPEAELVLIAVPVFAGRIPALAAERVKALAGAGRKAVTLVVYGNRAYEDALLELNDCVKEAGFQPVASAAFVAHHSIVRFSGIGRPDGEDKAELAAFGSAILAKLAEGKADEPSVPGNRPYREGMKVPATPIFLEGCVQCGRCLRACPTGAIVREGGKLRTEAEKCILCMACVAACHSASRILPPPMQEAMNGRLAHLEGVRNSNESFL